VTVLGAASDLVIRFQWPALIAFCFASAGLSWALLALRSRLVPFARFKLLAPSLSLFCICFAALMPVAMFRALTGPVWRYECFGVWRLPPEQTCHLSILLSAVISALVYGLTSGLRQANRMNKGETGDSA
jgi:hypothetical protein